MNKSKSAKGITLVALIITIIVLLILAIATLGAVNDGNIIEKAQSASDMHKIGQEKEEINLAILEWQVTPANERDTLVNFLNDKFASAEESGDKIIVTMPSGRKYKVENYQVSGPIGDEDPVELDVSYLIIDNKVALLVNSGVDIEEKCITEIGQMVPGDYTTADEAIIALASSISVKRGESEITQINPAISYINTNMLRVGNEFTTKEQTLAALAIYTADKITVNNVEYDMMRSGYLISIDDTIQNTIVVQVGDMTETILIEAKTPELELSYKRYLLDSSNELIENDNGTKVAIKIDDLDTAKEILNSYILANFGQEIDFTSSRAWRNIAYALLNTNFSTEEEAISVINTNFLGIANQSADETIKSLSVCTGTVTLNGATVNMLTPKGYLIDISENRNNTVVVQVGEMSKTISIEVQPEKLSVTLDLYGLTSSNTNTEVEEETEYTTTLTPKDSSYTLPSSITVKMGGTTLTAGTGYTYNNSTGELTINSVTGPIEVTAEANCTDSLKYGKVYKVTSYTSSIYGSNIEFEIIFSKELGIANIRTSNITNEIRFCQYMYNNSSKEIVVYADGEVTFMRGVVSDSGENISGELAWNYGENNPYWVGYETINTNVDYTPTTTNLNNLYAGIYKDTNNNFINISYSGTSIVIDNNTSTLISGNNKTEADLLTAGIEIVGDGIITYGGNTYTLLNRFK